MVGWYSGIFKFRSAECRSGHRCTPKFASNVVLWVIGIGLLQLGLRKNVICSSHSTQSTRFGFNYWQLSYSGEDIMHIAHVTHMITHVKLDAGIIKSTPPQTFSVSCRWVAHQDMSNGQVGEPQRVVFCYATCETVIGQNP